MKKFSIVIIVLVVIFLSSYLYYREGTLPVNKSDISSKIFVVQKGDSLNTIAKNLQNEGFIRNKIVFYAIIKKLGIERTIQAGDFRLSPSMDANTIAKNLTHGTQDVWLTLIEGTRKEEMAHVIAQNFDIPESEFIKNAQEGYLFPDTYLVPREATATSIIDMMEKNFNSKFDINLQKTAQEKGLNPKQVVILASMVEKEARKEVDRPIIAGIIIKRLQDDWMLNIDATIQYAVGYQPEEKTWWKKYLSLDDLKINSLYNTYEHTGLPPDPICNPGLASIKAVVYADTTTPYMYYLSDKNGQMHYAATLEEHNANVTKYLQ
ncbi:MAG: endolytic transglycosylase MltG [bacterium]|nr:endolytic transglycosylase MltG [bacterium]